LFSLYHNKVANQKNKEYSWYAGKRQENIEKRGLDFVEFAPKIFADPNVVIRPDNRKDYGEKRYLAFGIADGMRLCLCFTPRKELIHLITIYKANKKDWEKNYEQVD